MSALERLSAALADRYRIERELGQGGMATVYLAHDLRHEREVAIKVLHPDLGAVLGSDRFLSEIKTTARLQHPHILPLLDSGASGTRMLFEGDYALDDVLHGPFDVAPDGTVLLVRPVREVRTVVIRDFRTEMRNQLAKQGGT